MSGIEYRADVNGRGRSRRMMDDRVGLWRPAGGRCRGGGVGGAECVAPFCPGRSTEAIRELADEWWEMKKGLRQV
jgi:hypothetical protein